MLRAVLLLLLLSACGDRRSRPQSDSSRITSTLAPTGSQFGDRCHGGVDSLITPAGIGGARIWMSFQRLIASCGARDTQLASLDTAVYHAVVIGGPDSLVVAVATRAAHPLVEHVRTMSPFYRTRSGLRVGSMLREINTLHGPYCVYRAGNEVRAAIKGLPGVSLTLGGVSARGDASVTPEQLGRIPDTTRVTSISLDGLADSCAPASY